MAAVAGQHHNQQRNEELQLHAAERQAGDRAELSALGRLPPVVDWDAE